MQRGGRPVRSCTHCSNVIDNQDGLAHADGWSMRALALLLWGLIGQHFNQYLHFGVERGGKGGDGARKREEERKSREGGGNFKAYCNHLVSITTRWVLLQLEGPYCNQEEGLRMERPTWWAPLGLFPWAPIGSLLWAPEVLLLWDSTGHFCGLLHILYCGLLWSLYYGLVQILHCELLRSLYRGLL